jgi:isopentenyl-diphosphate delta-isomerase
MNEVLLVNKQNEIVGTYDKLLAHEEGLLHRAFSIFIFNKKGELLIQQRAATKYHSPNLWANTCCGHPMGKQTIEQDAAKRLLEELGLECELTSVFEFEYKAEVGEMLIENEYDHVLIGITDDTPVLNSDEVQAIKYERLESLNRAVYKNPELYAAWFVLMLKRFPVVLMRHKNKLLN